MESVTSMLAELDQIIETAKEVFQLRKNVFADGCKSIGLSEKFIVVLKDVNDGKKSLEDYGLNEIEDLMEECECDVMEVKKAFYNDSTGNYESYFHFLKIMIQKVRDNLTEIAEMAKDIERYENQKEDIINNFVNKINSEDYKKARENSIENLKKDYESLPDDPEYSDEKKSLKKRIDAIETAQNFMFLLERFTPTGWKKEKQRIMEGYFSYNSGQYNMERYRQKMIKLGYNPHIYRAFLNIEEKLLPEVYLPLNNLFIYHVNRYIGHADMDRDDEVLNVHSIIDALMGAVTDKITPAKKEALINVMKRFNEYFMDDMDYFKENNHMYKYHPSRIAVEENMRKLKAAKEAEEALKNKVEDEEVITDTNTEESNEETE